jgi:AraC-like DNA-binding protein
MRRVPFLSLPERIVDARDSQTFAETVNLMLRLRACDALLQSERFESRTGVVPLGQVSLLASSGSPIVAQAEALEYSTFMVAYPSCIGTYRIEGQSFPSYCGNIVHIPPVSWTLRLQSHLLAGLSLLVPAPLLQSTATAMGGGPAAATALSAALQATAELHTADPRGRGILGSLLRFFEFVESVLQSQAVVPEILRLDDLLVRQLLLLMQPGLGETDVARLSLQPREPWFEDLLAWIDAHCDRPLSLTELEARACCSRRTLQYMFRKRFHCGPMQWVRRRRLQQARQLLLEAGRGTTVRQVSLACGYINLSSFCRDYRQQFGCTATEDLRRRV